MNPSTASVTRHYAALTDLVDYVNDRLLFSVARGKSEPSLSARCGRLQLDHDRIEAQVGPFRLESAARALRAIGPVRLPVAWMRTVVITSPLGREMDPGTLIRLQASEEAAIAMDRLYRLLHMLNHLAVAEADEPLWVPVSDRHLRALDAGHGGFFEDVLRACGLGSDRVVLVVRADLSPSTESTRMVTACLNYRARGFGLALSLDAPTIRSIPLTVDRVRPDWLVVPTGEVATLRGALSPYRIVARGGYDAGLEPGDRFEGERVERPRFAA